MDGKTFIGLACAGISCMGGAGSRTASHNSVLRSSRARRRAFDKESEKLKIAHEKMYGVITQWPEPTHAAIERRCKNDAEFAIFMEKIRNLQQKWFD